MNIDVDEAMEIAAIYNGGDDEMHRAGQVLAKEVERLRAEVEMGHLFHRIAVKERDFERLLVEALREELAAAKASSAVPVKIDWFYSSNLCEVIVNCNDEYEASEFGNWLHRRTKENLF